MNASLFRINCTGRWGHKIAINDSVSHKWLFGTSEFLSEPSGERRRKRRIISVALMLKMFVPSLKPNLLNELQTEGPVSKQRRPPKMDIAIYPAGTSSSPREGSSWDTNFPLLRLTHGWLHNETYCHVCVCVCLLWWVVWVRWFIKDQKGGGGPHTVQGRDLGNCKSHEPAGQCQVLLINLTKHKMTHRDVGTAGPWPDSTSGPESR